jgi:hypothetical protein
MGRFVVRDRAATLDPAVTRLLPTPADVDDALARQRRGETATASVGGVLAFDLGPDTANIDAEPLPAIPPTTREFAKELIEDYGPAGLWKLSLRGMDLQNLTDVELRLNLRSFETDIFDLQPKVATLIDRYERDQEQAVGDTLDRIVPISLRQRFPDALPALAGGGSATLDLAATDFPDIPQPRIKTVVALVVDDDGRGLGGVALELARPDAALSLARTTTADGFSEDLTVPLAYLDPPDRVLAVGDWRLTLSGIPAGRALDDVRLFFVCELVSSP